MKNSSLYVHIPFCENKCSYCDFCSFVGYKDDLKRSYIDAVIREAYDRRRELNNTRINTIFIGGGTPSCLANNEIKRLIDNLRSIFDMSQLVEFTIECNPNSLSIDKLIEYKLSGVTRISIGVQSYNDRLLKILGRIHDHNQAINAVTAAVKGGFEVNIDLMIGLPAQSFDDIDKDIDIALGLGVGHISCYSLILEENTPMFNSVYDGKIIMPPDDTVADYYDSVVNKLQRSRLMRYEVSNFGKPCIHNIAYWRLNDYLGLGVAAHSFTNNTRRYNTDNVEQYIGGMPAIIDEILTDKDYVQETIMLGLRLSDGIKLSSLHSRLDEHIYRELITIFNRFDKYFICDSESIKLKDKYIYTMNSVLCLIFEEMDDLWQ